MGGPRSHDTAMADDRGSLATLVRDEDSARWHAHARIDFFELDSIEAARVWHGLKREPNGPELLEWATATRGTPEGDSFWEEDGNLLTRLGLARLGNLFIGATGAASQALNAGHCRVGLGDSSTAAATTDTDLGASAGSTHRQYKTVDSITQGTGANSGVTTIVATFTTAQANFQLNEWGIDGGTADGTTVTSESASTPGLCNHKIITSPPTKTSIVSAVFTGTITVA